MNQDEFIDLIKSGAIEGYKQYKILPSLTIAQAILESGWGKYAPGNNCFGIKWYKDCGYDKQLLTTHETYNGKDTIIQDYFKVYDTLGDCLKDHAALLTTPHYAPVVAAKTYIEACTAIKACGYATAPDYTNSLIQIIEQNNLQSIDVEAQKPQYKMYIELEITEETKLRTDLSNANYGKTFHKGDHITAIDVTTDGLWYLTEIGYVWKNSTKPGNYPFPFCKEYRIKNDNVEVMDKPNGMVIHNFGKGDDITATNEAITEKWYQVIIDGEPGWINGKDLEVRA